MISKIIETLDALVPKYLEKSEDYAVSEGNVAFCILEKNGVMHGKMYGKDKLKQRHFFQIAYAKASQAWITKTDTGEYEKLVFSEKLDFKKYGIKKHDFVGWAGGLFVKIEEQEFSLAFSGLREKNDVEILKSAIRDSQD